MSGPAELLADCDARGIRLLPAGDGGLTINAPREALTTELLARLKACKGELLERLWSATELTPALARDANSDQNGPNPETNALRPTTPAEPAAAVCRCGATRFRDVRIHDGQSVRRDCSRCGRFIDFPVWYGNDTLLCEQ